MSFGHSTLRLLTAMAQFIAPEWAVPSAQEVVDCCQLATSASSGNGAIYETGVMTAVLWAADSGRSPLTDADVPASYQAAEEEFFVAGKVELGESPLGATVPAATAQGVGRALAWLLGWEPQPPIELPRRPVPPRPHPDLGMSGQCRGRSTRGGWSPASAAEGLHGLHGSHARPRVSGVSSSRRSSR